MQGISIPILMQNGTNSSTTTTAEPLPPLEAEHEYAKALERLTGEQYELVLPPHTNIMSRSVTVGGGGGGGGEASSNSNTNSNDNTPTDTTTAATLSSSSSFYEPTSPLYTIRHVLRSSPTHAQVLGIYYVVEGVVYKAPHVRSVMKTNVSKTLEGIAGACQALAPCARYLPSTGYTWIFDNDNQDKEDENEKDATSSKRGLQQQQQHEHFDPIRLARQAKKRKMSRPASSAALRTERTAIEEEGVRASESMDQILVRVSKSRWLVGGGG